MPHFDSAYYAEAIIDPFSQFDFCNGGGIDISLLGLGQTDKNGNITVSKFGGKVIGMVGFMNISTGSKKVVFCGILLLVV